MKRIYVAGPYTQGDVGRNVGTAIDNASYLIAHGFAPYVPHLSHFLHIAHAQRYETWLALDLEWLAQCDALLRLPGESPGAEVEVDWAIAHYMPIFYSVPDLMEAMK